MPMLRLIVLISFVLIQISCYSQKERHQSALVILKSGDSLNGFVSNASLDYRKLKFRRTEDTNFTTFGPDEVLRFVLADSSKYESHVVKYDGENQAIEKLPYNKEPQQWTEENVFLRVVAKGSVSLFEFQDSNGRIHFVISRDEVLLELLSRMFIDTQMGIRTNKKYIGQLRSILTDCPTAVIKDDLKYDRKALFAVMNKYYACMGIKPNVKIKGETKVKIGLAMGLFYETQQYKIPNSLLVGPKYRELSLEGSGFHTGLSFEISRARPFNKFSMYLELNYKNVKSNDEVPFYNSAIELQILPRFNYWVRQNKLIFCNAGVSIIEVFDSEVDAQRPINSYFQSASYASVGIVVGVGFYPIRKEKIDISLECRAKYGRPHGEFNYVNTFSSIGFVINVIPKFRLGK